MPHCCYKPWLLDSKTVNWVNWSIGYFSAQDSCQYMTVATRWQLSAHDSCQHMTVVSTWQLPPGDSCSITDSPSKIHGGLVSARCIVTSIIDMRTEGKLGTNGHSFLTTGNQKHAWCSLPITQNSMERCVMFCYFFNPLMPRRTQVSPLTEISILF